MTRERKTYLLWIFLSEAVGLISSLISRDGTALYTETIVKPALSPPAVLFPIVWTILYALMGISAARIALSPEGSTRSRGLNLFIAQLIVNFFWSPLFFNARAYGFALVWLLLLWLLVVWMILSFWKTDRPAALLQLPYVLWLTFAAWLNYGVWKLNP